VTLIGSRWAAGALALLGLTGMALRGQVLSPAHVDNFAGHPRVVIISDIGNEPDDQMSFVRLFLYSNELDLEATIASTSTWRKAAAHPVDPCAGTARVCDAQGWRERSRLEVEADLC
jgi:hypothetical protein